MDKLSQLERDFNDLNLQIEAIRRLLKTLEAKRETIYFEIQDAVNQEFSDEKGRAGDAG